MAQVAKRSYSPTIGARSDEAAHADAREGVADCAPSRLLVLGILAGPEEIDRDGLRAPVDQGAGNPSNLGWSTGFNIASVPVDPFVYSDVQALVAEELRTS